MKPSLIRTRLSLVLFLAFLVQWALLAVPWGPTWDAAIYYAYARSLAFDQDLRLENDLRLSYETASPDFAAKEYDRQLTATGRVDVPFAIGTALLWLPLLLPLRGLAWLAGPDQVTGFEWPFLLGTATLSALYGLVAFGLAWRLVRRATGRGSALAATLTLMVATPLLYYQFREPLYAHVGSALVTTVVIAVWWRQHDTLPTPVQGMGVGALIGLAALVRWQNVIYTVLPLVSATWAWWTLPGRGRKGQWQRWLGYLLGTGLAAVAVFSLQAAIWRLFYGTWLTVPQGEGFMVWTSPYFVETLFSPLRGLLAWMPIFFPALLGLLLLARHRRRLVLPLLLVLLLSVYVNASAQDWFAGGGYGPRRFTGELAIFVLGYAGLLHRLPLPRPGRGLVAAALGVGFGWHQWILLRYGLVERIGGQVVSMAPDFAWTQDSWSTFLRQMAAHVPAAWRTPADFFMLPGSPLHRLLTDGTWPWRHALVLAALVMLLLVGGWGWRRWAPRPGAIGPGWLWPVLGAAAILVADAWLLLAA